jgi:hypothetical protein
MMARDITGFVPNCVVSKINNNGCVKGIMD